MRTVGSKNLATPGRRRAILDAALAVFVERGVDGATLDAICARLGLTKGSVYHHFRSKEEIAVTLYAEAIEAIHAEVSAPLASARTAREGIEKLVRGYLRWFERNPELGAFVFRIMDGELLDERLRETREAQRAFEEPTARWLKPFVARGEVERLEPQLYVSLVIGPSRDLVRTWLRLREPAMIRAALRVLPRAAWESVARRVK